MISRTVPERVSFATARELHEISDTDVADTSRKLIMTVEASGELRKRLAGPLAGSGQ
jgi:hypothetical protein